MLSLTSHKTIILSDDDEKEQEEMLVYVQNMWRSLLLLLFEAPEALHLASPTPASPKRGKRLKRKTLNLNPKP